MFVRCSSNLGEGRGSGVSVGSLEWLRRGAFVGIVLTRHQTVPSMLRTHTPSGPNIAESFLFKMPDIFVASFFGFFFTIKPPISSFLGF